MNRVLASLTFRQLLGQRRNFLLLLVAVLPIGLALIYRFTEETELSRETGEFAVGMADAMTLTILLPLAALILGSAALGSEIEDGTAVFLLTKPISRWRIIAVKIAVSSVVATLVVVPATMVATWIIHHSPTADGLMFGLGLSTLVAAVLYCAVFVALSAFTNRAIIVGLLYVFIWEAFATRFFSALRWLSIREYATGWGEVFISSDESAIYFDPYLSSSASLVGACVAFVAANIFGARCLNRFEIGERS